MLEPGFLNAQSATIVVTEEIIYTLIDIINIRKRIQRNLYPAFFVIRNSQTFLPLKSTLIQFMKERNPTSVRFVTKATSLKALCKVMFQEFMKDTRLERQNIRVRFATPSLIQNTNWPGTMSKSMMKRCLICVRYVGKAFWFLRLWNNTHLQFMREYDMIAPCAILTLQRLKV